MFVYRDIFAKHIFELLLIIMFLQLLLSNTALKMETIKWKIAQLFCLL